MITPLLQNALSPLVDRHRRLRSLYASGGALLIAALVGLALLLGHTQRIDALCGALVAFFVARIIARRWVGNWEPDYRAVARTIEERHPELHALLRTAVEQQPDPQTKQLHYLQQRVVAEAVAATRRHQWLDTIPLSRWVGAYAIQCGGIAALVATFYLVKPLPRAPRTVASEAPGKEAVTVTPGDAELERGSGLVVLAEFHHDVPSEAVLVLQPRNQAEQRLALVRNLGDPAFGGGLPEVDADLSYRVEYAGQATRSFTVKVFEHPKLERADATLDFPAYTRLPQKLIPDTHRVSAVEGSKLGVAFKLNKPVKSATLVAKDGTKVPLAVQADKPLAELRDFGLRASQSYELRLEDTDGRVNKVPAQFFIEALPNRRPELKVATPKGDSRVSPIEEVAFRAEAWDDFGLARYGLSYTVGTAAEQSVDLGKESGADEKRPLAHLLKLEEAGVKPDDLVAWYLWAEDTGPDGKVRRTATDMYFAEVRPFEEIYRQGDEQEGKPGQGEETEKLAQLQKQIVSATWNLQRAEEASASPQPTPKYLQDEPVIRGSQAEALAQAQKLGEKAEEAKTKALIETVTREMTTALERLDEAAKTAEPLPRALASEKAAYNALLKLAAHQFNVSKSKSQSGKEAKGSKQEQMDELELKEDKKRYETKREADPQQNEQQREQLAILNRLKELAQRQNDINERMKELQTALQEAKTEREKDEVQRQLKRLREEEQQMLADIDETKQKMEQSPQQAQFAEERKQLEQTRAQAQKAAEAMEKGEPSQALASGTRAQRELQQMRDDFRKKTSNQFREEMRDLRADARDLAERQKEIAEQMKTEAAQPQRQTLDASSDREKLGAGLTGQQAKLSELTEAMKRVSEQAEAAEPLLAKELYDALRKTAQAGTGDTLEKTQLLAERGYKPQAQKFEEKARQEIEELKTGVEKAAESVLGDEAEALRQARAELDALTQQLNREIAQARPDLAQTGAAGSPPAPRDGEGAPPAEASGGKDGSKPGENSKPQEGRAGETAAPTAGTGGLPEATPTDAKTGTGERTVDAQPGKEGAPGPKPGEGGPGEQPGKAQTAQAGQQPSKGTGEGTSEGTGGKEGAKGQPANQRPGAKLAELSRQRQREGADGRGGVSGGPADGEQAGPLTGEKFVEWQDRLRNVEEMLDAPELRNEVARVRELAKGVRAEFKRHSVAPNWDLVDSKIRTPLAELRNRVTEELSRRESTENIVPIDRDPVPAKYAERVRRYYEDLGRSR